MGAALALVITAQPLAAQGKQTTGAGAPGSSSNVNESELLIPGGGATTPQGAVGQTATGAAGTQTPAPAPQAAPATPGVTTWDFLRMLIILAAVVGVIYLIFWLLRRGSGKKIQENNLIHVLGSRSLAGNRALHLVEVGTSVYLVGASDGGVELIAEITDKESLDSVHLKAAEENPGGRRNFPQILSEIFRPAKKPMSLGEGIGLFKGQRERLRKL
ncbi:MAG: flagellar biosynthetic protein FliO [Spirochaetia bacterium]|jgi:flagellar protein FliO/FliZ